MASMFDGATSCNGDLSKWDVSRAVTMDDIFLHTVSFNQTLCDVHSANSNSSEKKMFKGSPGSISRTIRATAPPFLAKLELEGVVDAGLNQSPADDCSIGPQEAIVG